MRFLIDKNISYELAALVLANLESIADAVDAGAIVAFGRRGIRIRRLLLR